jgi:hypothetical protein
MEAFIRKDLSGMVIGGLELEPKDIESIDDVADYFKTRDILPSLPSSSPPLLPSSPPLLLPLPSHDASKAALRTFHLSQMSRYYTKRSSFI